MTDIPFAETPFLAVSLIGASVEYAEQVLKKLKVDESTTESILAFIKTPRVDAHVHRTVLLGEAQLRISAVTQLAVQTANPVVELHFLLITNGKPAPAPMANYRKVIRALGMKIPKGKYTSGGAWVRNLIFQATDSKDLKDIGYHETPRGSPARYFLGSLDDDPFNKKDQLTWWCLYSN